MKSKGKLGKARILLSRYWDKALGRGHHLHAEPTGAQFVLWYKPSGQAESVRVGLLDYRAGEWSFEYASEYRARPDLRPLEGLGDVNRVYRSEALFPFFAVRIPDPERPDIQRRLGAAHVAGSATLVDMLRIFGRRTVSSPSFLLEPATS